MSSQKRAKEYRPGDFFVTSREFCGFFHGGPAKYLEEYSPVCVLTTLQRTPGMIDMTLITPIGIFNVVFNPTTIIGC